MKLQINNAYNAQSPSQQYSIEQIVHYSKIKQTTRTEQPENSK